MPRQRVVADRGICDRNAEKAVMSVSGAPPPPGPSPDHALAAAAQAQASVLLAEIGRDRRVAVEFTTLREKLFKIGARVIEHGQRIRVHLPTSCVEAVLFRQVAMALMPAGP